MLHVCIYMLILSGTMYTYNIYTGSMSCEVHSTCTYMYVRTGILSEKVRREAHPTRRSPDSRGYYIQRDARLETHTILCGSSSSLLDKSSIRACVWALCYRYAYIYLYSYYIRS